MKTTPTIPPGRYPVKKFAELAGLTEHHVRRCAQGRKGCRLPNGFKAVKPPGLREWVIVSEPQESSSIVLDMTIEQMCHLLAARKLPADLPLTENPLSSRIGSLNRALSEGDSIKLSVLRELLLQKEMNNVFGGLDPLKFPYRDCENKLIALLRDKDIAAILADRWGKKQTLKDISEAPSVLERLDQIASILPLQRLERLLDTVRVSYQAAVESGSDVTISISFHGDGTWKSKRGNLKSESGQFFLDEYISGKIDIPPEVKGHPYKLLGITWMFDVDAALDEAKPVEQKRFPDYSQKVWLDHIRNEYGFRSCISCGTDLKSADAPKDARANKKFCDEHRSAYHKWIQKTVNKMVLAREAGRDERAELEDRVRRRLHQIYQA